MPTTRKTTSVGKGLKSPSARAYRALQTAKKKFCQGKTTKTAVKAVATRYKKAAVKAGKSATTVDKTINRVLKAGCTMTSSVAARKKRTAGTTAVAARKRKTTTTRKRA